MIYNILSACHTGYDILLVFLKWQGFSLSEIAEMTSDSKAQVFRQIQRIKERMQ